MKKNILIVDELRGSQYITASILKQAGYNVAEARTAVEALIFIHNMHEAEKPFDLFVVDIKMPQLSGVELVRGLTKRAVSVPVLAIANFTTGALASELEQYHCPDTLVRPFRAPELIKKVSSMIREHEQVTHTFSENDQARSIACCLEVAPVPL